MSRWMMVSLCSLALAFPALAQDDLDALLAGLGDEPAVSEAAATAAPAEEAVETLSTEEALPVPAEAAPADDPFADLLAAEPVAEDVAAEAPVAAEVPAVEEEAVADPFADLLDEADVAAEEAPAAAAEAVEDAPAAIEEAVFDEAPIAEESVGEDAPATAEEPATTDEVEAALDLLEAGAVHAAPAAEGAAVVTPVVDVKAKADEPKAEAKKMAEKKDKDEPKAK